MFCHGGFLHPIIPHFMPLTEFFGKSRLLTLAEAAAIGQCTLDDGDLGAREISGVAAPSSATSNDLAFLSDLKYRDALRESKAAACVIEEKWRDYVPQGMAALFSSNPYHSYALIATALFPTAKTTGTVHPSAVIDATAIIGAHSDVGAFVTVDSDVHIGEGASIAPNVHIGKGVHIGKNVRIAAGCTISHAIIGDDVEILPGARIGQEGFGFATDTATGRHVSMPQLGIVRIGHRVSVGANTTVDRGALGDTIIEDDARLDNLVQIGHNVRIGKGAIVVAQVGIAGSARIGAYAMLGGQVGVAGHLTIGDKAKIAAQSGVATDLEPNGAYGGAPAEPLKRWHRKNFWLSRMALSDKK